MSTALPSQLSPLDHLHRRKDGQGRSWIDSASFLAGERFAADLGRAGMLPKVTMDWSRGAPRDKGASSAGLNPTEAQMAARQRVQRALDAVGPELSGPLIDLCGFEKGLEQLEREHNWPVRSAKVVVRIALGVLARHYGYSESASGPIAGPLRAWSPPDAKPSIERPTTVRA